MIAVPVTGISPIPVPLLLVALFRFWNLSSLEDINLPWARPLFGTDNIPGIGVYSVNHSFFWG